MRGQEIEQRIRQFLQKVDREGITVNDKIDSNFTTFGKRCEAAARKQFLERKKEEFGLRMSNIGRPLRTLWLEKTYGRQPREPESVLNMFYGDLVEAAMMLILESIPEINITEYGSKTELEVDGQIINGTLDLGIDKGIWDIKSASPYSYEHKFDTYESLKENDDFGYIGQLFGYSESKKKEGYEAQGWVVVNKANGHFKCISVKEQDREIEAKKAMDKIRSTVAFFKNPNSVPPACDGVVKETFYKKETGREHLGPNCMWCDYKTKCHPSAVCCADKESKAKNAKPKWYTKLSSTDPEMKARKRVDSYLDV